MQRLATVRGGWRWFALVRNGLHWFAVVCGGLQWSEWFGMVCGRLRGSAVISVIVYVCMSWGVFDEISGNACREGSSTCDASSKPAIAQLVEHLTVDCCSHQMVTGSIPVGRIFLVQQLLKYFGAS